MFWKMTREEGPASLSAAGAKPEGRFVLHRHRDEAGEHLDLRLECEGYLLGWRIDSTDLDDGAWAGAKAPHPLRWLEEDGDATREAAGVYAWERFGPDGGVLLLQGDEACSRIRVERVADLTPGWARSFDAALASCGATPADASDLIRDGATARARAIERLCGLGRELDGHALSTS